MIVPARRRMPPTRNYHIIGGRMTGMGDATQPPTPNYESCQPWDGACVQRNTDKGNAYALAMAGYVAQRNYDQCQANARLSIGAPNYNSILASCDAAFQQAKDEAAQTAAVPPTWGPPVENTDPVVVPPHTTPVYLGPPVDASPSVGTAGDVPPVTPVATTPNGQVIVTSNAAPASSTTTPAGQTVVTSSGVNTTAAASSSILPASITNFDFSSIPTWGWIAAAGAAFLLFGGGGRGR